MPQADSEEKENIKLSAKEKVLRVVLVVVALAADIYIARLFWYIHWLSDMGADTANIIDIIAWDRLILFMLAAVVLTIVAIWRCFLKDRIDAKLSHTILIVLGTIVAVFSAIVVFFIIGWWDSMSYANGEIVCIAAPCDFGSSGGFLPSWLRDIWEFLFSGLAKDISDLLWYTEGTRVKFPVGLL